MSTPRTYGYLGPEATFTHQALLQLDDVVDPRPFPDVLAAIDAVVEGTIDAALVPIENSVEGGVSATLDHLAAADGLMITAEVLLPVRFVLCATAGTTMGSITEILTHPVADAQVRGWLSTNLPAVPVRHVGSTAGAAAELAADPRPGRAAVCAEIAAETYQVPVLVEEIADNDLAVTRFVVISRVARPTPPTGADKTTLVLFQREDHSGALLEILDQFASRGINLCRIESRPTKTTLGSYCFSVDAEGHLADARMGEALLGLHRVCKDVKFLGSYPRADGQAPVITPGTANADFAAAAAWLAQLRGR
ncbi:prephenate dehydratase [Propionibacteriaceae bacterium Y2011]|uniref:prephenate dehydratase n=1 Tax=Microlunatus sp. Y2014 TaxID=3418488 RepID=UPI003B4F17B2